jgi:hypothetical protein
MMACLALRRGQNAAAKGTDFARMASLTQNLADDLGLLRAAQRTGYEIVCSFAGLAARGVTRLQVA